MILFNLHPYVSITLCIALSQDLRFWVPAHALICWLTEYFPSTSPCFSEFQKRTHFILIIIYKQYSQTAWTWVIVCQVTVLFFKVFMDHILCCWKLYCPTLWVFTGGNFRSLSVPEESKHDWVIHAKLYQTTNWMSRPRTCQCHDFFLRKSLDVKISLKMVAMICKVN